ncbi:NnrS family protein [Pseudoalteromonas sp. C2R02]|uniref:NnrS family protein n=1 Tax=Pseudoalteromonas sp. C2R02 TaxID=2841565 RepID=UPI001C08B754|nr:NnrS family protein [Pseudoalteromonas sp. C2R02]MBU2969396.1 NnrS family protein [Pseudoalteromonas sp. C2R02]
MIQIQDFSEQQKIAPVWRLAFRSFFLAASAFSILAVLYWLLFLNGIAYLPMVIPTSIWHGHEMIFGFVATIAIGFLLTASQTWTGLRSIHGKPLMVLFLLWLTARVALFFAFYDLIFYIALIAEFSFWSYSIGFLAYLLVKSGNQRNLLFIPMLSIMMLLDLSILISAKSGEVMLAKHLMNTAVLVFTMLITLLGGRVIPFFTRNGLKNIGLEISNNNAATWIEIITPVLTFITVISYFSSYFVDLGFVITWLFVLCAVFHCVRVIAWQGHKTFKVPLLWSLHLSYLLLPLGFAVMAASLYSVQLMFSDALHLITIGTMALMILAMMSRVSLGHTGRPLQINSIIAWAYLCILMAAIVRVCLPLIGEHQIAWLVSGILWSIGFGIFVFKYAPILLKARVDGAIG